jgi:hypothetical protein
MPNNQNFGWFFATVFGIAAAYARWISHSPWDGVFLGAAIFFAFFAAARPAVLEPFNRLWYRLGILMGHVVSPIVLAAIYFGVITPVALCMRMAGRDELRLRKRKTQSYWIHREPAAPLPDSFRNQF